MKILVIEDDRQTREFVVRGLQEAGYVTAAAPNGDEGLEMALLEPFDVAVVDVMLPGIDGIGVIRRMRARGVNTPVIVLSARDGVDDRVLGLQAGGDDYMTKPFAFAELLARIQARLRRTQTGQASVLQVADLRMDLIRHKVFRGDTEIVLQPREFALLEYLMRSTGRVVSKTMIIQHVWDYNFDPRTNIVEARISRLRDKVDRPFETKLIHTIRGVGYVLEQR